MTNCEELEHGLVNCFSKCWGPYHGTEQVKCWQLDHHCQQRFPAEKPVCLHRSKMRKVPAVTTPATTTVGTTVITGPGWRPTSTGTPTPLYVISLFPATNGTVVVAPHRTSEVNIWQHRLTERSTTRQRPDRSTAKFHRVSPHTLPPWLSSPHKHSTTPRWTMWTTKRRRRKKKKTTTVSPWVEKGEMKIPLPSSKYRMCF